MNFSICDIEALLFTAHQPLNIDQIKDTLEQFHSAIIEKEELFQAIATIQQKYLSDDFAFHLVEIDGGFSMLTKPEYGDLITYAQNNLARKRLSHAALEALSIIVYKNPVTKGVVEQIRGVNSDYVIQKLLEKDLIKIVGRSEEVGRPLLYGIGDKFLDHFGMNDLTALPKLQEFESPEEEIGVQSIEELLTGTHQVNVEIINIDVTEEISLEEE